MKRLITALKRWGQLVFVTVILLGAFSFAMFQGGFVSWFIFYMILPFVLYSLLLALYPLKSMKWEREVESAQLRRGDSLNSTIRLSRVFPFPLLYTVLSEQADDALLKAGAGRDRKMVLLGFRKQAEWTFKRDNMPRGEYILEGIEIETADFFGWVRKSREVPLPQKVLVYPRITEIPYQPIDVRYDQGASAAPFTFVKDTTMASGIRDYQPGDRVSWIHWKSFARTQTMQTKEFEARQSQDLVLLDDRAQSDKFELQVELVASLLRSVVRSNSGLVYLSAGRSVDYFPNIRTEGEYQQVLTHLAKVQPDAMELRAEEVSRRLQQLQPPLVLYVTARLTDEMASAVMRGNCQRRTCVCFVVMEAGEVLTAEERAVHETASARGMIVKTVRQEEFAGVFKEVNHP